MKSKKELMLFIFFLVGVLLFVSLASASYYETQNVQYYLGGGSTAGSFANSQYDTMCTQGTDFILQVDPAGCEPAVVRSDLLEEQNVYVFCPIQALKINPIIDVKAIRGMTFGGQYSEGVSSVGFYGSRSALGYDEGINTFNYQNVGYAVVGLTQNPNESAMPDYVSGNLTATIRYDIENAFGLRTSQFYLPVLTDSEWQQQKNKYYFWEGRGYLRAEDITPAGAKISIYSDESQNGLLGGSGQKTKIGTTFLEKGEQSEIYYMPGLGCYASLRLQLQSFGAPDDFATLQINSEYYDVAKGEYFLDNKCRITDVRKNGVMKSVDVVCQEDSTGGAYNILGGSNRFTLTYSPKIDLEIDGEEYSNVTLGDYLYSNDDETQHVYLGYLDSNQYSENKEKTLTAYLITLSDSDAQKMSSNYKTGLTKDMLDYYGYIFSFVNAAENPDRGLLLNLAKGYSAISFATWDLIKNFDKTWEQLKFGESTNFRGKSVKLVGYSEGVNLALDEDTKNYYDNAVSSYDDVLNNYFNEKYPSTDKITTSQKALADKIKLANSLQQYNDVKEWCDNFASMFPDGKHPSVCSDNEEMANSGLSSQNVVINGKDKQITLKGVYEPSPQDYSVEVLVRDPKGNKQNYVLTKDKIIYLGDADKDGSRESIRLVSIDSQDKVTLSLNLKNLGSVKQGVQQVLTGQDWTFTKGVSLPKGEYTFTVQKINYKEYAKVRVVPDLDNSYSRTNFSFKIGIEKRGIKLSPEVTKNKVKKLNETISKWEDISNSLGDVVQTMKTACLATGTFLTVENLLENSGGKAIARQEVMKGTGGWNEKCANLVSNKTYSSKEKCFLENSDKIEDEVNAYQKEINRQDGEIGKIDKANTYQSSFLGERSVNSYKSTVDFTEYVKGRISGEVTDSKGGNTIVLDQKFKDNIFNNDSIKKNIYDFTDLKNIDVYYSLWGDAKTSGNTELARKYETKLHSVLYDIVENYGDSQKATQTEEDKGVPTVNFNQKEIGILRVGSFTSVYGTNYYDDVNCVDKSNPLEKNVAIVPNPSDSFRYLVLFDDNGIVQSTVKLDNNNENCERLSDKNKLQIKFEKATIENYNNEYKNPEVRFYESEPYKGLPALIPLSLERGWYVYIKQTLPVGGQLASYDESGAIRSYWICNVGENGREEFASTGSRGDDVCSLVNENVDQPISFTDLDKKTARELFDTAKSSIQKLSRKYDSAMSQRFVFVDLMEGETAKIYVGKPETNVQTTECTDFMSVKDCQLLFNVCDPVICPSSRCDFGGQYPVKDVVQSGIIGSLALCLPNINEGIYIPVCLAGVKAGIDGWLTITKSYQDCLQQSLDTGETVGICDEVNSIYMCQFFWEQALPIAKLTIPKILSAIAGQGARGGGEYQGVQTAWDNAKNSVDYFTQSYALNSYKAFKARSVNDIGSAVCKNYVSLTYPEGSNLLDAMTQADSPPQFTGRFDEIPFTTATNPPISQYKVFYHIFAGNDQGVYYKVYLRGADSSFYQDGIGRIVASSYIPQGDYKTDTVDFTAPSGFNELCISVNGQEECDFGQVTTNFALDYVKDQYVKRQVNETVSTEKGCVSGTTDWYQLLNPNVQAGVGNAIDPQIYNQGIIRICATDNPGTISDPAYGTSDQRWIDVGSCGDSGIRCWLDKQSIPDAFQFQTSSDQALKSATDRFVSNMFNQSPELIDSNEFQTNLDNLNGINDSLKKLDYINSFINNVFFSNEKAHITWIKGGVLGDIAKRKFDIYLKSIGTLTQDEKDFLCEDKNTFSIADKKDFLVGEGYSIGGLSDSQISSSFKKMLFDKKVRVLKGIGETGFNFETDILLVDVLYEQKVCNAAPATPESVYYSTEELSLESPKFEFLDGSVLVTNLCYKFFDNEWHWTKDCIGVGSSDYLPTIDYNSKEGIVVGTPQWIPVLTHENLYGPETTKKNQEFIDSLNVVKTYDRGMDLFLNKLLEDKGYSIEVVSESTTIDLSNSKSFKITINKDGSIITYYFVYNDVDKAWYWGNDPNPKAVPMECPKKVISGDPLNGNIVPTNVEFLIKTLNINYGGDFLKGSKIIFQKMSGTSEISSTPIFEICNPDEIGIDTLGQVNYLISQGISVSGMTNEEVKNKFNEFCPSLSNVDYGLMGGVYGTCQTGVARGVCINSTEYSCSTNFASICSEYPDDIQCCTGDYSKKIEFEPGKCEVSGKKGDCLDKTKYWCSKDYVSGYCSGSNNFQCCLGISQPLWNFESALERVSKLDLTTKYGYEANDGTQPNKVFVDQICDGNYCEEEKPLLNEAQCTDVKGYSENDWFGQNWWNTEENMEYVYNLLKDNYEVWKQENSGGDSCELIPTLDDIINNNLNDLNQRVIDSVSRYLGKPVPNEGSKNCYTAAEAVYEAVGLGTTCKYSDEIGKTYAVVGGSVITTTDANANPPKPYAVNPSVCLRLGGESDLSQDEKLSLLQPGDMVDFYSSQFHGPHTIIFIEWVDKQSNTARLFDWAGEKDSNGKHTYRYFNAALSDDENPIYLIRGPYSLS